MSDCNLIKLKRGFASEWQSLNPTLQLGEPGYEKDTKKLKIGDGSTPWNNLSYIGIGTPGPQGPQGAQGPQGVQGPQGEPGDSTSLEDLENLITTTINTSLVAGNGIDLIYDSLSNSLTIQAETTSLSNIIAGSGLAKTINSTETILNIIQGNGISVGADSIGVDNTVVRTTGNQHIFGDKIFSVGEQGSFSLYNENIDSTLQLLASADIGGNPVNVILQSSTPDPTLWLNPETTEMIINLPDKNGILALTTDIAIHGISNLGILSGTTQIHYDPTIQMQTLSLNGTPIGFYKGDGWPTSILKSVDLILKITVLSPTSIIWGIVNEWYSQPPAGSLGVGVHLFLLRSMGHSVIEGHYIGNKTN